MNQLKVIETVYEVEHTDGFVYRFTDRNGKVTAKRVSMSNRLWSHGVLVQMPSITNDGKLVWAPTIASPGITTFHGLKDALRMCLKETA